ncbi:copper resistance CopC family protein [Nonomuraea mesophila]|uniref:copper resistance CopC family protein n=1 Tax=Nonomuraea mesophila TaxID=2530382 RepID=UPI001C70535E|nr:copper resistance CopC family protein [Nonomuraea mesophila]
MRRLFTVLLLAFAAAGIALSPAEAHNVLIGSDPKDGATLTASPARVTLVFDQPVRQGYAQVGVTGSDGSAWADGAAEIAAERVSVKVKPLAAGGSYVVGYRILSADGHPVTGKIGFSLAADATGVAADPKTGGDNAPTQETGADATAPATDPDTAAGPDAAEAAANPDAAEAAANGGAGMAVVWIVGALLILATGTAVALRRAKPAQATATTAAPATTSGTTTGVTTTDGTTGTTGTRTDVTTGTTAATGDGAAGTAAGSTAEETKA